MRHDDAAVRMMEPLRQLERMLEPQRQIQRMLEPQRQIQRMLEPQRQIQRMLEPQRQIERMLEPQREIERMLEPQREIRRMLEQQRQVDRMLEPQRQLQRMLDRARGSERWTHLLDFQPWKRLDEELRISGSRSGLEAHLGPLTALASELHDRVGGPVGVLSSVPGEPATACFCWTVEASPTPLPELAFWSAVVPAEEPDSRTQPVQVTCDVVCARCREKIEFESSHFHQVGTSRVHVQVRVSPVCESCLERLANTLEGEAEPTLLLIDGEGQSSDPARGRSLLRLVKPTAEDREGEPDEDQ